jgi:hypothetical protein
VVAGTSDGAAQRLYIFVSGTPAVYTGFPPRVLTFEPGSTIDLRLQAKTRHDYLELVPLSFHLFLADIISLKTIIDRAVLRLRQPLVLRVRLRTVAKTLSIGFAVRMCFQCSAGKS